MNFTTIIQHFIVMDVNEYLNSNVTYYRPIDINFINDIHLLLLIMYY